MVHRRKNRSEISKRQREAEAVAFMVCHTVELETGNACQNYIQLYQGDAALLMESLENMCPADGRAIEIPSNDVHANDSQGKCLRVDRGGSWLYSAWLLRLATRERDPADFHDVIMGFRMARTLPRQAVF